MPQTYAPGADMFLLARFINKPTKAKMNTALAGLARIATLAHLARLSLARFDLITWLSFTNFGLNFSSRYAIISDMSDVYT